MQTRPHVNLRPQKIRAQSSSRIEQRTVNEGKYRRSRVDNLRNGEAESSLIGSRGCRAEECFARGVLRIREKVLASKSICA